MQVVATQTIAVVNRRRMRARLPILHLLKTVLARPRKGNQR